MVPEDKEASGESENQGLNVRERAVSSSFDIDWREQAENIFSRIWKLPELGYISACSSLPVSKYARTLFQ